MLRPMTWVWALFNVGAAAAITWWVLDIRTRIDCDTETDATVRELCTHVERITSGGAIAAGVLAWFLGFVVISLLWIMTAFRAERNRMEDLLAESSSAWR